MLTQNGPIAAPNVPSAARVSPPHGRVTLETPRQELSVRPHRRRGLARGLRGGRCECGRNRVLMAGGRRRLASAVRVVKRPRADPFWEEGGSPRPPRTARETAGIDLVSGMVGGERNQVEPKEWRDPAVRGNSQAERSGSTAAPRALRTPLVAQLRWGSCFASPLYSGWRR